MPRPIGPELKVPDRASGDGSARRRTRPRAVLDPIPNGEGGVHTADAPPKQRPPLATGVHATGTCQPERRGLMRICALVPAVTLEARSTAFGPPPARYMALRADHEDDRQRPGRCGSRAEQPRHRPHAQGTRSCPRSPRERLRHCVVARRRGRPIRAGPAGDRGAPAIPAPLLVTIAEAAKVLGVGRSTLYELIARRELEVIHIGRAARIPATALDGLVSRLRQQSLTGADVTVGPPR